MRGSGTGAGRPPRVARGDGDAPRRKRAEPTPAQRALGLLVRREHSRRELVRKLEARGVEAEDAEAAVARMAEAGWQDDGRFAEGLARMRAQAGYGPVRIRAELATHGIGEAAIRQAFDALAGSGDDAWLEAARDLVRRRYGAGAHDDPVLRRKAAEFLFRRGFDGDTVRAATRFDPDEG